MNIFKKGFTDSKGGIMPSVFTSLDSKMSRPLTSRQELENWIRHNKELAGLTDAYRKGLAVSKQLASKTKMMSPALCDVSPKIPERTSQERQRLVCRRDWGCRTGMYRKIRPRSGQGRLAYLWEMTSSTAAEWLADKVLWLAEITGWLAEKSLLVIQKLWRSHHGASPNCKLLIINHTLNPWK